MNNRFFSFLIAGMVFSSGAYATGLNDVFKGFGLTPACEDKILAAVDSQCNLDSDRAEGEDRLNPCQDFNADIAQTGNFKGQAVVGGYAGDDDPYFYAVTIIEAGKCKYSLTPGQ